MSLFLREVRTSSGVTAVQIAVKEDGMHRIVEHLGSPYEGRQMGRMPLAIYTVLMFDERGQAGESI